MGIAQAGNIITDGANVAIQGEKPVGIAAQGQVIWQALELSWHLIARTYITNPATTTQPLDTTGAVLLIGVGILYGADIGISDNMGNSWTTGVAAASGSFYRSQIAYCINPTTSAAHTFTFGAPAYSAFAVLAFAGPSSIVDQNSATGGINNTGLITLPMNPITPTADNSLIIAATTVNVVGASIVSIDSGFTITDKVTGSGVMEAGAAAYLVQETAATLAPIWTLSMVLNNFASATMLSFKPS